MDEIMNYSKGVIIVLLINVLKNEIKRCKKSLVCYGPDSDNYPTAGEMRIYLENQVIYGTGLMRELQQKLKNLNELTSESEEEENWNYELYKHTKNINDNDDN